MLALAVLATGAALGRPAAAQTPPAPPPAATPAPSAGPTAAPKFFRGGATYVSVGVAVDPDVRSEFQPRARGSQTTFDLWNTGEFVLAGRARFVTTTDYRRLAYDHRAADAVTTIGGRGTTVVPSFRVAETELEQGIGVGVAPHVYAALGDLNRTGNYGYPPVNGIGYGIAVTPRPDAAVSPYGWFFAYPNAGGRYTLADGTRTALTYRGERYRAGVLLTPGGSRIGLDVGIVGTRLRNRTNAPSDLRSSSLTAGLAVRF